jgi:hypothetical protein
MIVTPPAICRWQELKATRFYALKVAPWMGGAAECEVEQDFEMTPVGGSAALVVDRSPEPESSAADQDRHVIELLADSLNWARREDPQIVRPTSARRGRSEDSRLLEARSSDPPAL